MNRPDPREDLAAAFEAAVARADPASAFRRACQRTGDRLVVAGGEVIDLLSFERIWMVGAGKAVVPLAEAAFDLLGDVISGYSFTTRHNHAKAAALDVWEAGHPVPDVGSLAGAADALRIARNAGPSDLIVCLLTGGASSLWTAPPPGVALGDLQFVTESLLRSGATIQELNCVRRHLSCIAGGRLALASASARLITLAVSDVVGNQPDAIGSGPTVPDPTTFAEALAVLASRAIRTPSAILKHLQKGAAGELTETPKRALIGNTFHIIASVAEAVDGAATELRRLGYQVTILSAGGEGDASTIGRRLSVQARSLAAAGAHRAALIWAGESTVQVTGSGRGGRNQEMALAAALALSGSRGITLGCFATDGSDGPTDAAGGYADGSSVERALSSGLDPAKMLAGNDSHTLLKTIGDLVLTGPTGTNVNDLAIALVD